MRNSGKSIVPFPKNSKTFFFLFFSNSSTSRKQYLSYIYDENKITNKQNIGGKKTALGWDYGHQFRLPQEKRILLKG